MHTCANSSTEMTRFPSLSKHSKAALAIFSHPSRASSWYVLIAATQNSSKSNFLCESGSIFKSKIQENMRICHHAKATTNEILQVILFLNCIRSCNKAVSANRKDKPATENPKREISWWDILESQKKNNYFSLSFFIKHNLHWNRLPSPVSLIPIYSAVCSLISRFTLNFKCHTGIYHTWKWKTDMG